jgi:hypothetical protein
MFQLLTIGILTLVLDYDEYTYYDPHSEYYYQHTDWPTYAHPETERVGFPSLDGKTAWLVFQR